MGKCRRVKASYSGICWRIGAHEVNKGRVVTSQVDADGAALHEDIVVSTVRVGRVGRPNGRWFLLGDGAQVGQQPLP
jgi:hypothetical protein